MLLTHFSVEFTKPNLPIPNSAANNHHHRLTPPPYTNQNKPLLCEENTAERKRPGCLRHQFLTSTVEAVPSLFSGEFGGRYQLTGIPTLQLPNLRDNRRYEHPQKLPNDEIVPVALGLYRYETVVTDGEMVVMVGGDADASFCNVTERLRRLLRR
ncbi:hypothetical protein L1987_38061 [Smallanthus sonchifolius]|uniref:Uncharacterized protein n=1 Tax=Smallanthus sonchifolius TaxID=185202 RepID=A0ACB9HI63_9ASTR|nr:hypothetical protein L1987_38061 [Smallanthus sonchifolius]